MESTTIALPSPLELTVQLTDEQFFQLCQENRELKFERTASGGLIIRQPTGSETGRRNIDLSPHRWIIDDAQAIRLLHPFQR